MVCVPQDPRVLDSMLPYLTAYYGNPHSRTHAYGWESEAAMENARRVSLWLFTVVLVFLLLRKIRDKRPKKKRRRKKPCSLWAGFSSFLSA